MTGAHILHFTTRWLRGGMEAKTVAELRGLREQFEFTLATGAEASEDALQQVRDLDVPVRRVEQLGHYDPLGMLRAVQPFRALVDDIDPDLVHLHSTEAGIVGRWALRNRDLPVVYTLHGLPFGANRSWPLRTLVKLAERRLARHTTRFIANADAIRDRYLAEGIGEREQFVTIYSGIDVDAVANADPVEVPGESPGVLFAGRLEPGKGVRRLVRAMDDVEEVSLLVAGDGPIAGELRSMAADRPWLYVLGYRDDLPGVMQACDVLALPSDLEGTPRVITEAMACGLPVVASEVGGIGEQVVDGETGLLVDPTNRGELVAALAGLVGDDDLRREMGEAARKRVERFSEERLVEETRDLYADLLGREGLS